MFTRTKKLEIAHANPELLATILKALSQIEHSIALFAELADKMGEGNNSGNFSST